MPSESSLQPSSPLQAYWQDQHAAQWHAQGLSLQEMPSLSAVQINGHLPPATQQPITQDGSLYLSEIPNQAIGELPCCLWLGPSQWLVISTQAEDILLMELKNYLPETYSLIPVSSSRCAIEISGEAATSLLNRGCGLNLCPSVFTLGQCAQTLFAQIDVLIHKTSDEPRIRLWVARSEADYLWRWLLQAAKGFRHPS